MKYVKGQGHLSSESPGTLSIIKQIRHAKEITKRS